MEVKSVMEQLFFSTVFLILNIEGNEKTKKTGTGFFFNYNKDGKIIPFLVTAKHVVEGTKEGQIRFHTTEGEGPNLGKSFTANIGDMGSSWFFHKDDEVDIALSPIAPIINQLSERGINIFYRGIIPDIIPSNEQRTGLDAIEEILFIGYPSGFYDKLNNLPISRKGITASPISIDYEGKKMFLVDASVFPGSSGSPVFLVNTGSYSPKQGGLTVGNRIFFLGVLSQTEIRKENFSTHELRQYLDIGKVIRSETIVEAIDEFIKSKNL